MNRSKWYHKLVERTFQLEKEYAALQDIEDPLARSIRAQILGAEVNGLMDDMSKYICKYPLENTIEMHNRGIGIFPMKMLLEDVCILKKLLQDPFYYDNTSKRLDELEKRITSLETRIFTPTEGEVKKDAELEIIERDNNTPPQDSILAKAAK